MRSAPDFSTRRLARRPDRDLSPRLSLLAAGGLLLLTLVAAFNARRDLTLASSAEAEARQAARDAREHLRAARASADPAGEALTVRADLARRSPPPHVLGALAELMPARVRLEQANLAYAGAVELELRVVARGARDYDAFLERLAEARAFQVVSTGAENREGEVRALIRLQHVTRGMP
jgi:Tfp pilus assembly protein PilN